MNNYGVFLGICVQNNDPEMRGRIKVYIPILAPTIQKLNENINVDKFFAFIGKETNPQITTILEEIKELLPWAEYAGPIFGGNASGRYNATNQQGTTSDSNAWEGDNVANGFRPAQNYTAQQAYPDAFIGNGGGAVHKNKFVNQFAYQYTPSNYSGLARGLFSIPNVGAHVYVFFLNGDRNFPIYFAAAYGETDIKRIFTKNLDPTDSNSVDYPANYENVKGTAITPDNKTFRSGTVFNSNKHAMEFIDTDLHEIMKFTHYSGSFKEFNNYATIELATGNDQKLVIGDQFLTVQKNKSEFVGGNKETLTAGDLYINIGETDPAIVRQILEIHKTIHERKLLFDIQRVDINDINQRNVQNTGNIRFPIDLSPLQHRQIAAGTDTNIETGKYNSNGFFICPVCGNKKYDPYDLNYAPNSNIDALWNEAREYKQSCTGTPFEGVCHSIASDGRVVDTKEECTPKTHPHKDKRGYYAGMKCACCNGDDQNIIYYAGYSPSSQTGSFELEPLKQTLDEFILQKTPELFRLEKQLGEGDEIQTISMNKIITIGTVMNDMKSFRTDPFGKMKIDGCWVAPQKTYENLKPSPHVEYVDVADIPGGDYIITAMNKYKLLVGAKGINIQTYGPLDIYGTIVNFNGEQINISSKNEVLIDGGERFALRARKIALMPFEHNAVVVEGQLHVTRNVIIQGGCMLEGEIGLLHVTAPTEWHRTEPAVYKTGGSISNISGEGDECIITGSGILSPNTPLQIIKIPQHTHYFKGIPTTFLPAGHREAVRKTMIGYGINSRETIAAALPATPVGTCDEIWSGTAWANVRWKIMQAAWLAIKTKAQSDGRNIAEQNEKPGHDTRGHDYDWKHWDDFYTNVAYVNDGTANESLNDNGPLIYVTCDTRFEPAPAGATTKTATLFADWKLIYQPSGVWGYLRFEYKATTDCTVVIDETNKANNRITNEIKITDINMTEYH